MGQVVLPNYPHHVVQRWHNRQVVFAEPADFECYLETLAEFKAEYAIRVYGFCLMTNHVQLVLEPGERVAGLGQLMKRLAGRQTRYMNRQEQRSVTLWESRYKSSPVQAEAYLLACCRYVELNPVRASRYTEFVHAVTPPGEWKMIRSALQRSQLTGNERFVDEVAAIIGRRIEHRQPGRPRLDSKK